MDSSRARGAVWLFAFGLVLVASGAQGGKALGAPALPWLQLLRHLGQSAASYMTSDTQTRCVQYERHLRDSSLMEALGLARATQTELFAEVLSRARAFDLDRDGDLDELGVEARRVLADLRECQQVGRQSTQVLLNQPTGVFDEAREIERLLVRPDNLLHLYNTHQEVRSLPLDQRCQMFDDTLRRLIRTGELPTNGTVSLIGNRLAGLSKPTLFQRAVDLLAGSRVTEYDNSRYVVDTLRQCMAELAPYRYAGTLGGLSGTNGTVLGVLPTTTEDSYRHGSLARAALGLADLASLGASELRTRYEQLANRHDQAIERAERYERELEHLRHRLAEREAELERLRLRKRTLKQELQQRLGSLDAGVLEEARRRAAYEAEEGRGGLVGVGLGLAAERRALKARDYDYERECEDERYQEVLRDPVEIARRLRERLGHYDSSETKCQKYFIALNHPGKVTHKFLKMVAKMRLPQAVAINDPDYLDSLDALARSLASRSGDNVARAVAQELEECSLAGMSGSQYVEGGRRLGHQRRVQMMGPALSEGLMVNGGYSQQLPMRRAGLVQIDQRPVEFVSGPMHLSSGRPAWGYNNGHVRPPVGAPSASSAASASASAGASASANGFMPKFPEFHYN